VLATVMFTDIVGSTQRAAAMGDSRWRELLGNWHTMVRAELAAFRGREVDTAGDGLLATFDGPARAIRCACSMRDRVHALGLQVRTGLHTGECDVAGDKVVGIAVHIGARVAAIAGLEEVVVSSTVKDLVAGSDLKFSIAEHITSRVSLANGACSSSSSGHLLPSEPTLCFFISAFPAPIWARKRGWATERTVKSSRSYGR